MNKESDKINILITGASGQLGQCIKKIEKEYPQLDMCFTNSGTLDITKKENVQSFFAGKIFDFVINCAAYTNVEQSEKQPEKAFLVNAEGVKNLAEICKKYEATLIHISTDYVFDGKTTTPYNEEDTPNPINEYGKSKLAGEKYVQELLERYFIIRTSWLYSEFGHNFFKTILKKLGTEKELTITATETGTPTNANDLARFILNIIETKIFKHGVFHFSNLGEATWFDFAKEILRISDKLEAIKLEKTDNYPIFARRPKYSVLSKEKVIKAFKLDVLDWKNSLRNLHSII